ncbi:MAG: tetratricopeptide repeat protein [Akkermansiaceae bacterium]|nr:tetratricopeptide repeat protein [Akkermansiaceae bacterium]MCF7733511.1 tetratricopeptide repeat protein [Akkermansiaceae bacterium]
MSDFSGIIRHMMRRTMFSLLGGSVATVLIGCGPDYSMPLMAGNNQGAVTEGNALYQEAKQADDAGKAKRAAKLYGKTADRYSFIDSAPQARFRQAELLEQLGDVLKAFKAYQEFLTRYQGSGLYSTALNRQAKMAQAAADGEIKNSFLGLKTRLDTEKVVEMLTQVIGNAPKTPTASKARFTIGELYRKDKEPAKAIAAYRELVRDQPSSPQAPDAMFQIGVVLTEEADRGNQNQATIDMAREAFNDYLNQYPGHPRNAEAKARIAKLGKRDLQHSFEIAEYYRKAGQFDSAKVYYRDIVKEAPSGKLHDQAQARLRELGE